MGGTVPPPPPPNFANAKIRAEFEYNSGKYAGDIFFSFQNMLGILGVCIYPYANTGIEDRKFWAHENKCTSTPPSRSTRFSGLARILAWILRFGHNMPKMCVHDLENTDSDAFLHLQYWEIRLSNTQMKVNPFSKWCLVIKMQFKSRYSFSLHNFSAFLKFTK